MLECWYLTNRFLDSKVCKPCFKLQRLVASCVWRVVVCARALLVLVAVWGEGGVWLPLVLVLVRLLVVGVLGVLVLALMVLLLLLLLRLLLAVLVVLG